MRFILKKSLFWIIAALLSIQAHAGISVESGCYERTPKSGGKSNPFFFFQSYSDDDLPANVGAFLRYNNSNSRIALVFYDEVQGAGAKEGEYQRFWLEIVGKNVTGEYVEYGDSSGNPGGKYIKYTNFKNNRTTVFRITTIDSPCGVGR